MPNIAEALRATETARSSREHEEAMALVIEQLDRMTDCCQRLCWFDIGHELQAIKSCVTKRRRNYTRH